MAVFSTSDPFPTSKLALTLTRLSRGWNNTMALKQGDQAFDMARGTIVFPTNTGTTHNYAPGASGTDILWSGASDWTATGIAGGVAGRVLHVHNVSGSVMRLTHNDAGSTVGNRLSWPSVQGQYLGVNGVARLVYDGNGGVWRGQVMHPGLPIVIAFSAGNFSQSGGTGWTVTAPMVDSLWFVQDGNKLTIAIGVSASTIVGTPTYLTVALPSSFVIATAGPNWQPATGRNNGTFESLAIFAVAAATALRVYRGALGAWAAGATNNDARFTATVWIN